MEEKEFGEFRRLLQSAAVTLVAVSKKMEEKDIMRVYGYGQRDFGENYVQELVAKRKDLPADIRWHFIGHLQRNKVKEIVGFVHLIHGIDSERLLKEVDKQAAKADRVVDVLLQVHIAREETKFGFDEKEIGEILPLLNLYRNVRVKGLMGMATFTDDESKVAAEFAGLHSLFAACKKHEEAEEWNTLSMGMSADYKIAISKGSTMMRIGTLIFGARQ